MKKNMVSGTDIRLAVLCGVLLLTGCVDKAGAPVDDAAGWFYKTIHIDGMPCVIVGRASGTSAWSYDGVSCDWSKKGNSK